MWIKYDITTVNKWYNNNRDEKLNPIKVIGKVPFIAQLKISASYGPMQIMYESAYDLGFKIDPLKDSPKDENSLLHYKNAIPISMDFYVSVKMRFAINSEFKSLNKGNPYIYDFPLNIWTDIFNESMVYYNGKKKVNDVYTYKYSVEARTKEANVLPD